MMENKKIIVIRETVLRSIIKDTVTFLMFAGLMTFNHLVLSGSTTVDVLFIFLVVFTISVNAKKKNYEMTKEEAIKFLSEEK